jgi:hypothetical protein
MRTTLPPKFVLAWPEWTGHKYLHYHCREFNQESRTVSIWSTTYFYKRPNEMGHKTRYENAVVSAHLKIGDPNLWRELSFQGSWEVNNFARAAKLWTCRSSQIGVKALNFVTNGKFYPDETEVPIRFEPIRANYFTGQMEFCQTDRPLPHIFYKWDYRRWDWTGPPKDPEEWEKLLDACEKEWRELSHSQFVFVAQIPHDDIPLNGTWKQRVRSVLEFNDQDRLLLKTLKTSLGVERRPHGSVVKTVIKRCIKRFIARHPTRATTRLLQLLGASGDLKIQDN